MKTGILGIHHPKTHGDISSDPPKLQVRNTYPAIPNRHTTVNTRCNKIFVATKYSICKTSQTKCGQLLIHVHGRPRWIQELYEWQVRSKQYRNYNIKNNYKQNSNKIKIYDYQTYTNIYVRTYTMKIEMHIEYLTAFLTQKAAWTTEIEDITQTRFYGKNPRIAPRSHYDRSP